MYNNLLVIGIIKTVFRFESFFENRRRDYKGHLPNQKMS